MDALRALAEDGLELLGEIELGARGVIGDPRCFGLEEGAVRVPLLPGRWLVFGRAWEADPDELAEFVAVHASAVADFYARYDALVPVADARLPGGRLALLDQAVAADPAVVASLYEPDELPWVLAAGFVAGEGPGEPARVFVDADPAAMVMVALGEAPRERVGSPETTLDSDR